MNEDTIKYIAIYGTLKKGHRLNPILVELGGKFIGTTILNGYALMSSEQLGYPWVIKDEPSKMLVELWSIPYRATRSLDVIENVPNLYTREVTNVVVDGKEYECYIYVGTQLLKAATLNHNIKQIHNYE